MSDKSHTHIDPALLAALNAKTSKERLDALRKVRSLVDSGEIERPKSNPLDVNNHIHTSYSFSPYSPTKAVYMAYFAGLSTCGIIDHDSISGAEEFIEAGKILGIPTTIGLEMRVSFMDSPFADKRINNPDQKGNLYVTIHGLPHTQIEKTKKFLAPINRKRGERNIKMLKKINALFESDGIELSYEKDVLPLSMAHDGGSVTERHLLFALALKLQGSFGKGKKLIQLLERKIEKPFSAKIRDLLSDSENCYYDYDLLGALKSELVSKIYVDAVDECKSLTEYLNFCKEVGALSCAAYLGDISDSVTGDKKSQTFEDEYLDELFAYYAEQGFDGFSYMPSRNSAAQLKRVQALSEKHGFIQISGEDINQPRQKFVCEAARASEFSGLIDSTWALIGSERDEFPIVSDEAKRAFPKLNDRIAAYCSKGKQLFS